MGSITDTTKKFINWLKGAQAIPKASTPTAMRPFQAYLDKAYTDHRALMGPDLGVKTHISFSIFLRGKGTSPHQYAGKFDDEHQFSGSLPKVAAMFAAFKLRAEAKALAKQVNDRTIVSNTLPDFIKKLDDKFHLNEAVPGLANGSGFQKKPSYTQILEITGLGTNPPAVSVKFTDNFDRHMLKMIVPSDNCSAGECIYRLSYPYINVKLMEDGYFEKATSGTDKPNGIWLAGDYIIGLCDQMKTPKPAGWISTKQNYVREKTTNDCEQGVSNCGSAQNCQSKSMAQFFFDILLRKSIDPTSSEDMYQLLHKAQFGAPGFPPNDRSFVSRESGLLFTVDAVKIGQGPMKPDTERGIIELRSEGILIKWNIPDATARAKWDALNLNGEAAICWQNLPNNESVEGIRNVINDSISKFINQDPI